MSGQLDDYAKRQRHIRSLQPKVSSDVAHAKARRALAAAADRARKENENGKGSNSSSGPEKTGD